MGFRGNNSKIYNSPLFSLVKKVTGHFGGVWDRTEDDDDSG